MRRLALALALVVLAPAAARADLDEYLARPEPAYRWQKKSEETTNGCKVYDLELVSQEWQGKPWTHRLVIFRPENVAFPRFCTLYNTGGRGGRGDLELGAEIARKSGAVFAIVFGIPNQPLWGKTEDALVVHTWLEFMKSMREGKTDESWPLHFPMAKAVVKGMDAIQAFSKESSFEPVEGFLVCGASKRGWTSWLVGAAKDPRVKAIAPMVIDILNVAKQGPHMLQSYGKPSEQIRDYTVAGMADLLQTAEGRRLLELEDPWSYRERLTLPKLIINGTNDRYWTQDALNLYWDDLKGPKWVLYVPNSGHGLEDRGRVFATLGAFANTIARGASFPAVTWRYEDRPEGGAKLTIESEQPLVEARLFATASRTLDFRSSKWRFDPMSGEGKKWTGEMPLPEEGAVAMYGEAVYEIAGHKFTISTQIRILRSPKLAPTVIEGPTPPTKPESPKPDAPKPETSSPKRRWF